MINEKRTEVSLFWPSVPLLYNTSEKQVKSLSVRLSLSAVMSSGNLKANQLYICLIPFAGSVENQHLALLQGEPAAAPCAAIFSLLC